LQNLTFVPGILLAIICFLPTSNASAASSPTSGMANDLELLARVRFPHPTQCETTLLHTVTTGQTANCGLQNIAQVTPETSKGRDSRDLGADLVRWLVVDPLASKLVDPKGIQVNGALIRASLDLKFVIVPFPITFTNSVFQQKIDLSHSQLINFDVEGSQLVGIAAENVTVRGDFDFSFASSSGEVDIDEGIVGGDLMGVGGTLKSRPGEDYALRASGMTVNGSVYLNGGSNGGDPVQYFNATGTVQFRSAEIRHELRVDTKLIGDVANQYQLDLRYATAGPITDNRESWPAAGRSNPDPVRTML
jgi:hypothetical protein